jgi:hypothetical protein
MTLQVYYSQCEARAPTSSNSVRLHVKMQHRTKAWEFCRDLGLNAISVAEKLHTLL